MFRLYHLIGHPWSRILFAKIKLKAKPSIITRIQRKDPELNYFRQFWKLNENQYDTSREVEQDLEEEEETFDYRLLPREPEL
jgi:hypothetical protein